MENFERLKIHLIHIQNIVEHIKKKHLKQLEIITTLDGKKWIYDDKHHEWVDVTMPEGLKNTKSIR